MALKVHAAGASVEAELGLLGGEEDGLSIAERDGPTRPSWRSGGDASGRPRRDDWQCARQVRGESARARLGEARRGARGAGGIPLVLHGASGLPSR